MTKPVPEAAPQSPPSPRRAIALDVLAAHRAEILSLDIATLKPRDVVLAFGIATRAKNFIERRVAALRPSIDAAFKALGVTSATRRLELAETVFFDGAAHATVSAILLNSAVDRTVISEERAFALLRSKTPSLARRAKTLLLERQPRPPQPPPRFSAEKFRKLIESGVITQAEFNACLVPAAPATTVTVEVPVEIDEAIGRTMFRPPMAAD